MEEYLKKQLTEVNNVIEWLKKQTNATPKDFEFWYQKNLEIRMKIRELKMN